MSAPPRTEFWHKIQQDFPNDFWEVQPVKIDDRSGRNNVRFSFNQVHFERANSLDVDIPEVDTFYYPDPPVGSSDIENILVWKYGDKAPVYITGGRVYVAEGVQKGEAQRQAYYALNYLEGEAMVSGWTR